MFDKKNYVLNCDICDARKMKEEGSTPFFFHTIFKSCKPSKTRFNPELT